MAAPASGMWTMRDGRWEIRVPLRGRRLRPGKVLNVRVERVDGSAATHQARVVSIDSQRGCAYCESLTAARDRRRRSRR